MESLLEKYARLAVVSGVNLQKGQTLLIQADVEAAFFARLVCEQAYRLGAREVVVLYGDEQLSRLHYRYAQKEALCEVHNWQLEQKLDYFKQGACVLHILSQTPGIFGDCDAKRISEARLAYAKAGKEVQDYTMSNRCAWSIVAIPNEAWAKQVFAQEDGPSALRHLWEEIFRCVHVDEQSDPVENWQKHNATFERRVRLLNEKNFKTLHFTNAIGTDLYVDLIAHHRWEGGSEKTQDGIVFNANMPTEEVFTTPYRYGARGKVVASRPLDHNGVLIRDFYLCFQEGRVCGYDAVQGLEALRSLIEYDEGSCYLGEVALVPQNSPIAQADVLFYNTLFDENASCHLALGDSYPSCVAGGLSMTESELREAGANQSMAHVDFMFGTPDLTVVGIQTDGKQQIIMENGLFAAWLQ